MADSKGHESALIVPVELPAALQQLRDRLDPSAAAGVPAHVTLLYPFVRSERLDPRAIERVVAITSTVAAFPFALSRVQRWPDVVCLLPEPREPFSRLIEALATTFPDYPPYGGAHALADIVPHVTIAQTSRLLDLDAAERALPELLPVSAICAEVSLIAHTSGESWKSVWSHRLPTKTAG